jgi:mycothiol system anti-sigma-R factor
MTLNQNYGAVDCQQVMQSFLLLIDNEISEPAMATAIQTHFQVCPPCEAEFEHERQIIGMMKNLLASECCEAAPQELIDRLAAQTAFLAAQMADGSTFAGQGTQFITSYSRTEITIDGETTIEIETSHEIRHDF